ncbi:hypothetical protein, partial [Faecalibaculum rodentium]|uniref:hypothetical protein n=1 Tax=Faecalibaculum rodentium TaxID=1702221 RepID=UPI0025B04664
RQAKLTRKNRLFLKVIPQVVFIMAKKKCLENTNGISRHFFPFITRKMGCNQPTDRKTGLTVTAPFSSCSRIVRIPPPAQQAAV